MDLWQGLGPVPAQTKRGIPEWHKHLLVNGEGVAKPCIANVITVLREADEFAGRIGFDMLRNEAMKMAPLPWDRAPDKRPWRDNDDRMLAAWLQENFVNVGVSVTAEGFQAEAEAHRYHPVLDYLRRIVWDGKPRLDEWAIKWLGCANTEYVKAISAAWLISAVARVHQPGCKADCAIVLEGPQGTFKSSALRTLSAPWFTDDIAALGTKDAAEQTIGVWIVELAELDAVTRAADIAHVKAFMSRQTDRFRVSYGRRVQEFPRQCVFAATSNTSNWNRDDTGGRRWWPLACGRIDLGALSELRDQLWAEARDRYIAEEAWWLTDQEIKTDAIQEQEDRGVEDPLMEAVAEMVKFKAEASTADILSELGFTKDRQGRAEAMRIGSILGRLGWTRKRYREGKSLKWRYSAPSVPQSVPI